MFWLWFLTATSAVWPVRAQSYPCPGYTAAHVTTTDTGLTALLTLAGPACDTYGTDLESLTLLVEHQTGTARPR